MRYMMRSMVRNHALDAPLPRLPSSPPVDAATPVALAAFAPFSPPLY